MSYSRAARKKRVKYDMVQNIFVELVREMGREGPDDDEGQALWLRAVRIAKGRLARLERAEDITERGIQHG